MLKTLFFNFLNIATFLIIPNTAMANEYSEKTLPVTLELYRERDYQTGQEISKGRLSELGKDLLRLAMIKDVVLAHQRKYSVDEEVNTHAGRDVLKLVTHFKMGSWASGVAINKDIDQAMNYWKLELSPTAKSIAKILKTKKQIELANEIEATLAKDQTIIRNSSGWQM